MSDDVLDHFKAGHINTSLGLHAHSGARAMEFESADDMNAWFQEHGLGLIVVHVEPFAQVLPDGTMRTRFFVMVVKQLSNEQTDRMAKIQGIIAQELAKLDEAEEAQKEADAAAKAKELAEERELQALGRKCRDNHGGVIEENAKLRKENKTLRAKVNK